MPDRVKEKLVELLSKATMYGMEECDKYDGCDVCPSHAPKGCRYGFQADYLIANGVTVLQWIPASESPKEPGEYTVVQQHWCDGHLESKKGKWNGVEWFVDGRESLMVAYWMPPLPLPQPPKGE